MQIKAIYLLILLFSVHGLANSDKNKKQNVSIEVQGKPILRKNPTLVILFTENFSDSLTIIANKKIIVKSFFVTNESTTIAKEVFFESRDLKVLNKIVIQNRLNGKIIQTIIVSIKKGYSKIIIRKNDVKWAIRYTNAKLTYE
jgi:hypothetical protein